MAEEEAEVVNEIIDDSAEYSPKSDFNKGKLADDSVRRCIEARSQEMKPGFWNIVLTKQGDPVKTWVKDSRKVFIASVQALRCLLNPECERDSKIKEAEKEIEKAQEDLFKLYAYEEYDSKVQYDKSVGCNRKMSVKTGRKYMPDTMAVVSILNQKGELERMPGGWDNQINAYWDGILELYDYLFSSLNDLIDRLNYFKPSINYG